ncbi:hypothetical protein LTR97_006676 [Elasticomyces elasticus]|uniref:Calcineurin-like phosphoesterase domain-containing protein n=1 Tax=Elasticomyces elasticus TaxID=574655 RepID=A0AAN8A2N3_9PEZI|nr:hypothetical protein LTR97_006676 [Elasticomyces elasticus]
MALVRIMVISDTHGAEELPRRNELPKVDILLHCGDLTSRGRLCEYEKTLSLLASVDAELKLVIAGNHDVTLDADYWRARGPEIAGADYSSSTAAAAMKLMKGRKAQLSGVEFLHEGVHSFQLRSGAKFTVYASPYCPASGDGTFPHMAYRYESNQDRFNPLEKTTKYAEAIAIDAIPDYPEVDIVMTHTPPLGHLDQVNNGGYLGCRSLHVQSHEQSQGYTASGTSMRHMAPSASRGVACCRTTMMRRVYVVDRPSSRESLILMQLRYNEDFGAKNEDGDSDPKVNVAEVKVQSAELRRKWHSDFYANANAGWLLLTLHWSFVDDTVIPLSETWVGLSVQDATWHRNAQRRLGAD